MSANQLVFRAARRCELFNAYFVDAVLRRWTNYIPSRPLMVTLPALNKHLPLSKNFFPKYPLV
jgi:hypothetical protein